MAITPTILERAFALARSGRYRAVSDIRTQLELEGLDSSQVQGTALVRQLTNLCSTYSPARFEER